MRIWRLYGYGFEGSKSFDGRGNDGCGMGRGLLKATMCMAAAFAVPNTRIFVSLLFSYSLAGLMGNFGPHSPRTFSSINHHLAHSSHIPEPPKQSKEQSKVSWQAEPGVEQIQRPLSPSKTINTLPPTLKQTLRPAASSLFHRKCENSSGPSPS